jgi:hypothetical protein
MRSAAGPLGIGILPYPIIPVANASAGYPIPPVVSAEAPRGGEGGSGPGDRCSDPDNIERGLIARVGRVAL